MFHLNHRLCSRLINHSTVSLTILLGDDVFFIVLILSIVSPDVNKNKCIGIYILHSSGCHFISHSTFHSALIFEKVQLTKLALFCDEVSIPCLRMAYASCLGDVNGEGLLLIGCGAN